MKNNVFLIIGSILFLASYPCHKVCAEVLEVDSIVNYITGADTINSDSALIVVGSTYAHKEIFPHFRVAVDGGWQYRTAKMAEGMDEGWQEHYKKMKSGFHYDLQAAYFFTKLMGIEAMFSQQFFEHGGDGYLTHPEGYFLRSGKLNEKIAFNYIGANYLLRFLGSNRKNCLLLSVGFGYIGYNDRLFFNDVENLKITASALGINMTIGYDIGISKNFGIGFKLSLMGGSFTDFEQTIDGITTNETTPEKKSEGLGTVKISVGLRFNK
jgi:hypothetical protein